MGEPHSEHHIQIAEIFTSLQGEGRLQGELTTFIRTAGCSLHCAWCDTPYARAGGHAASVGEINKMVQSMRCPRVCITGGEPLEQPNIQSLISGLKTAGLFVSVETNGTRDIGAIHEVDCFVVDFKLPSTQIATPFWPQNWAALRAADELKFVIADRSDYEAAKAVISQHEVGATITLSPCLVEPVAQSAIAKDLAAWIIKDRLPVRYSFQLHKLLGLR